MQDTMHNYNSQVWWHNSLILFRRQRLVVSEFTLNWPNRRVQVGQGYIIQRSYLRKTN